MDLKQGNTGQDVLVQTEEKAKMEKKRSVWRRIVFPLFYVVIVIPIVAQLVGLISLFIWETDIPEMARSVLAIVVGTFFIGGLGFLWGRFSYLPPTFRRRYGWLAGAIIYVLLVACVALLFSGGDPRGELAVLIAFFGLLPFGAVGFLMAAFGGNIYLLIGLALLVYFLAIAGFAIGTAVRAQFRISGGGVWPVLGIIIILGGVVSWQYMSYESKFITAEERNALVMLEPESRGYYYWDRYDTVQQEAEARENVLQNNHYSLQIEQDFPRIDGATAFGSVYAPAARAIYDLQGQEENVYIELIQCNRTPNAYRRLIAGEADLIFVAAPSEEQIEEASAQGLELHLVPLAKEAFVFLVNDQNQVRSLTISQIQDIYSGRISNWKEVGGSDATIRAFQRPAGSGSQSTMENTVMQGRTFREPIQEEFMANMGGVIVGVADYRNGVNALGYSFRYYATQMETSDDIRLLAVDGVEPTPENIRNGGYPFTVDVYMVTATSENRVTTENTQKLMDWFLSEEGQRLVEEVGYVPLVHSF